MTLTVCWCDLDGNPTFSPRPSSHLIDKKTRAIVVFYDPGKADRELWDVGMNSKGSAMWKANKFGYGTFGSTRMYGFGYATVESQQIKLNLAGFSGWVYNFFRLWFFFCLGFSPSRYLFVCLIFFLSSVFFFLSPPFFLFCFPFFFFFPSLSPLFFSLLLPPLRHAFQVRLGIWHSTIFFYDREYALVLSALLTCLSVCKGVTCRFFPHPPFFFLCKKVHFFSCFF